MWQDSMKWFTDAKYGTFIHWGLYSSLGGEWNGQHLNEGCEWIMRTLRIPFCEYKKLANSFNPVNFDADRWMENISRYGSKYVCITAKHHDGFAMYDSKVNAFNIMNTPFKRDILKELSAACRACGMKFCVYYSQMQDWEDPDGDGNNWDYVPEHKDFKRYFYRKVIPQVTELLTNYGEIGMIWFDTPYDMPIELCKELRRTVKALQPDCIINGRIGYGLGDYRQMSDNCIPAQRYERPWETPMTLNDTWGYSKTDTNWKTPNEVVQKLADITSKGGNLLLNIGPDELGNIPEESNRILTRVGEWLGKNGESIYGADKTIEMPYLIPWGVCTMKPGHLYMHVMKYPKETCQVKLLNLKINVKRVTLLATGEELTYIQTYEPARNEDRFRVVLPPEKSDTVDMVIDVEYEGNIEAVPLEMLDTMYLDR